MTPLDDPDAKLPFIREILGNLRRETEGSATLLGFVGAPFTLVAYAVEGQANRHCIHTKKMMMSAPEVLHAALDNLAVAVASHAFAEGESEESSSGSRHDAGESPTRQHGAASGADRRQSSPSRR